MRSRTAVLLGLLVLVVPTLVGWRLLSGDDEAQRDTVVAYFADASPLDPGSSVRAFGVDVGSVQRIELDDGRARVTLQVDPKVLPLHDDATLAIRPVNLLGEHYVELDTGTPEAEFATESVVPVERTSSTVDVQDVIDTFDDPTATGLAALITTLGEGLEGGGAEAAAAIRALAPAMQDFDGLAEVLTGQNAVLNELIERVAPVAASLGGEDGETLDRLVASAEKLLSTLTLRRDALDTTVAELPATLRSARATLTELSRTAQATTPRLRALRPVTQDLDQISVELRRFADSADPALASLLPVLDRADELLARARPSVARLRAAGPDLVAAADDLVPLGDVLLSRNLDDLMLFVKKWALSTNGRDGLSHYFRGVVHVSPLALQDLLGPGAVPVTTPSAAHNGPRSLLDNLGLGQVLDNVGLGGLLDNLGSGGLLGGLGRGRGAADRTPGPDNATGLNVEQEQNLLDQLLGGR